MSFYKQAVERRQAAQTRQRRLAAIIVVAGLSLLVVAVFIFQSLTAAPNPKGALVSAEQAAYPQADGKGMGPADAPVQVLEFSDFQCLYCNMFHQEIQGQLVEKYIGTNQVRFEYHHFIVIDGNVGGFESRHAAIASECAKNQGAFWQFHARLFANQAGEGQGAFNDTRLGQLAKAQGLDMTAFNACFDSGQFATEVQADEALARSLGVNSTPTLFINGTRVENPLDFQEIQSRINSALAP